MLKAYAKTAIIVIILAASALYGVSSIFALKNAADGKVYWCKDFRSQADAQKAFDSGEEKYERLDGDKDGIACQSHVYLNKNTLKTIQVK